MNGNTLADAKARAAHFRDVSHYLALALLGLQAVLCAWLIARLIVGRDDPALVFLVLLPYAGLALDSARRAYRPTKSVPLSALSGRFPLVPLALVAAGAIASDFWVFTEYRWHIWTSTGLW